MYYFFLALNERAELFFWHFVCFKQGVIQHQIAECRLLIDQAKLLTLKAAHTIDQFGTKEARKQVGLLSYSEKHQTFYCLIFLFSETFL